MTLVKLNHHNRQVDPWVEGIFNSIFNEAPGISKQMARVNIAELDAGYEIELHAPGFDKSDFQINLEKRVLRISADKKQATEENADSNKRYSKREFKIESFTRSFSLPEDVDAKKVAASYNNGILTINLEKKAPAKNEVKQIPVK